VTQSNQLVCCFNR